MAFLLDINVLIARVDPRHEHHPAACRWLDRQADTEILTCPVTENGFLRIYGHPSYLGGPGSPGAALDELRIIRSLSAHRFIPDSVSIDDPGIFHSLTGVGPKQLTDLYLLGLAVHQRAAFATFDHGILVERVVGGTASIEIIG